MRTPIELLFEDFAARYSRGEHPDVRDYLERAGDGRAELASLLDGFLAGAPVQAPSEETLAIFAELIPSDRETPPMLALRVRLGLRRRQVVRQLCMGLGLDASAEERVARYYHELETGLLDPRQVSPRIWHHLATILGGGIRSLMVSPYEPPPVVVAAYYRKSGDAARAQPSTAPPPSAPQLAEPDEVDRLFTGAA
jgi:AcrR family transcriptional regulator